jgi:hypothetical protein
MIRNRSDLKFYLTEDAKANRMSDVIHRVYIKAFMW